MVMLHSRPMTMIIKPTRQLFTYLKAEVSSSSFTFLHLTHNDYVKYSTVNQTPSCQWWNKHAARLHPAVVFKSWDQKWWKVFRFISKENIFYTRHRVSIRVHPNTDTYMYFSIEQLKCKVNTIWVFIFLLEMWICPVLHRSWTQHNVLFAETSAYHYCSSKEIHSSECESMSLYKCLSKCVIVCACTGHKQSDCEQHRPQAASSSFLSLVPATNHKSSLDRLLITSVSQLFLVQINAPFS